MTSTHDGTYCAGCGYVFPDEECSPAEGRLPCPKCGATQRIVELSIRESLQIGGDLKARVIRYPTLLIQKAEAIQRDGHNGLALILCVTACEVATERAFIQSLKNRTIPELHEPLTKFWKTYDLKNERFRNLFTAISNLEPKKQPCWENFSNMVDARHTMVHKGQEPPTEIASMCINTATAMVKFLGQWGD